MLPAWLMDNWCTCGRVFESSRPKKCCSDCVELIRSSITIDYPPRSGGKSHKRTRILTRDEWTCQLCLLPIDKDAKLNESLYGNVDHIIARGRGGENSDDNYQATHAICNSLKGCHDDSYFKSAMRPVVQDVVRSLMTAR